MPRTAQPKKAKWTDKLNAQECGFAGFVERRPDLFYDENGIREDYTEIVDKPKNQNWEPSRGTVIDRTYIRNGKQVKRRADATHIRYKVHISPKRELRKLANSALGITGNDSPDDLRCRRPAEEALFANPLDLIKHRRAVPYEDY